ncbi:MAG: ParB N-terminal domain-containing protein [Candidatus Micrarchaeota archaeon]
MVAGLVPPQEQKRIFEKLLEYYKALYPGVSFSKEEKELDHKGIGDLYYTFAGEEAEATAREKMRMINSAIGEGYDTPIIVLQAKKRMILLDGHRRARVAFSQGMAWKALIIIPSKDVKFGIEDMVMGKIKDLYGK